MTKKATPKIYFILLFLFILLTGCSTKKASESAVSPEAEAVLNAMFTAPNDDLYSLDSSTVIGENSTADSENASVNSEKILENWNKLVGKYFETGRLEYFISTYGQTYLSEAAYNNTKITVKDISLDSKTDDSETVLVTFKINKEEMVEKIYFSYVEEIIDRKIGKEKRRLLKKGVSIGENIVSMALKKSQINPDDLLELLDYSNIKKAIFIFDDLERCGLSIIQTLGILNDLIENNGVKIIIIANQKEIGKVSDSSNLPHKYMVALDERIEFEDEKIKLDDKKVSKETLYLIFDYPYKYYTFKLFEV